MQGPVIGHQAQPRIDDQHLLAEQMHTAPAAVCPGVAELEQVNPPQHHPPTVIPGRFHAEQGNRLVQQLQPLLFACLPHGFDACFPGSKAVGPEPGDCSNNDEAGNFHGGCGLG
jgi:hypothetical protein